MPPLWRAYNQLKIKVRALPTCRNPVGEGAKRTRGLQDQLHARRSDMGRLNSRMVRAAGKQRQAGQTPGGPLGQQQCEQSGIDPVLKSYCH